MTTFTIISDMAGKYVACDWRKRLSEFKSPFTSDVNRIAHFTSMWSAANTVKALTRRIGKFSVQFLTNHQLQIDTQLDLFV